MEADQYKTPQKIFTHHQSPILKFLKKNAQNLSNGSTPRQSRTLNNQPHTPHSLTKRSNFSLFPVIKTPPAKRIPKIVNPFEASLTERLHLPIICSPSLFQRPATPQHSSTQFEWTIEEVSSLGPANVEPHETQFLDSPDPDIEAKAQAAISSYFKEHKIVPSPLVDSKTQRIFLSEISGNTPVCKPGRRIRESSTQTILTFPPVLPLEVEEILKPYFSFNENQQQTLPKRDCDSSMSSIDHDARDASLRRKLFDFQNYQDDDTIDNSEILETYNFSPPPKSPELDSKLLDNSLKRASFGSLSPISKFECNSSSPTKRKSAILDISSNIQLSPIQVANSSSAIRSYRNSKNVTDISSENDTTANKSSPYQSSLICARDKFLPRRSSSPTTGEMSIDASFNGKISRLVVNSSKKIEVSVNKSKTVFDADVFDDEEDEDDMQVSQLSAKSTCSSSSSNTPRSKRRSANRKNLSQSFSFHCSDDDDEVSSRILFAENQHPIVLKKQEHLTNINGTTASANTKPIHNETASSSTFYRTDSGFNEMTSTQDDTKFNEIKNGLKCDDKENVEFNQSMDVSMNEDVSMISCSTPSRQHIPF